MRSKIRILTLLAMTIALSIKPANANVIYMYSGNDFTFATSPYTTNDHVSIDLEFLTALAPNLLLGTVTPVSFSFNDGHQTVTSSVFGGLISIATDGIGAISQWDLAGCGDVGCVHVIISRNVLGNVRDAGQLVPQGVQEGIVDNSPGVWTASVVPEPSAMAIATFGLAGLGWSRRRRLASHSTGVPT